MKRPCCKPMADQLAHKCDQHPNPFDCPDNLIHRSAAGDYGIIVHDGGKSTIEISYCPWCGHRLSKKEAATTRNPM